MASGAARPSTSALPHGEGQSASSDRAGAASSEVCPQLHLGMLAGMCKNPQVDIDGPVVAGLVADVAAAVSRRAAVVY